MAIVILVIACVLLLLALHPYLTYPLTLRLVPERPVARGRPRPEVGPITLCFCAYNEAEVLPQQIEHFRHLRTLYPKLEILAYVDGASDRSGEILDQASDVVTLVWSQTRHGKSHGMNRLVARARTELVVFTDANVTLRDDALARLVPYFDDPEVGCVCGHLVYVNDHESGAAAAGSLLWRLEEKLKAMEGARASVMGADGSLFAIRRNLHRPVPDDIIDDMFLSFSILCDGKRVVSAPDVVAQEKSVSSAAEEFQRKIRIACQAYNVHRLVWPPLRRLGPLVVYMYLSHRYLRWMMPFLLAASAALFLLGLFLLLPAIWVGLLVLAGVLVLALGVRSGRRPFSMLLPVALSLAGVALGVLRSIRGERFQTWEPSTSIRREPDSSAQV